MYIDILALLPKGVEDLYVDTLVEKLYYSLRDNQ